jgi:hypothetical protein
MQISSLDTSLNTGISNLRWAFKEDKSVDRYKRLDQRFGIQIISWQIH